jgi:hypothetical protein
LISEVLYDPLADGVEWIELFNPTLQDIELFWFKIGDEEGIEGREGMLHFPREAVIRSGQVLIIAADALLFESVYGFAPGYEMEDSGSPVPDMIRYTAWAGGAVNMTNGGDELLLMDRFDNLVDSVSYGSSNWAFLPDVSDVPQGSSIERFPGYADTDSASDWREQPAPSPGNTPYLPPTPMPTIGPSPTPFGHGLLITEVMYDPIGSEPHEEWIEIYNDTQGSLELFRFKIGDARDTEDSGGMYRFPDGSNMAAGQVIVIANRSTSFEAVFGFKSDFEYVDTDPDVPNMIKYTQWAAGSVSLGNSGDEVLLLDSDDQIADAVSWGSSNWAFFPDVPDYSAGHTIERYPARLDTDSVDDWRDQDLPNPGTIDATPPTLTPEPTATSEADNSLLISEVFYEAGSGNDGEWIEIYNHGDSVIDIGGYHIGDEESSGSEGLYIFPEGTIISAGGTIVIARDGSIFLSNWGFLPDFEIDDTHAGVPQLIAVSGSMNLSNSGDEVILWDDSLNQLDAVSWGSSNWAFTPDVPDVGAPNSIERNPAYIDTDTADDWISNSNPSPGIVNDGW